MSYRRLLSSYSRNSHVLSFLCLLLPGLARDRSLVLPVYHSLPSQSIKAEGTIHQFASNSLQIVVTCFSPFFKYNTRVQSNDRVYAISRK